MNKRETGSRYEEAAAAFLQKQGLTLLEKNFRSRFGEIDLILKDGAYLVFTEVKYRADGSLGYPLKLWICENRSGSAIQPGILCIFVRYRRIHPAALMWWGSLGETFSGFWMLFRNAPDAVQAVEETGKGECEA